MIDSLELGAPPMAAAFDDAFGDFADASVESRGHGGTFRNSEETIVLGRSIEERKQTTSQRLRVALVRPIRRYRRRPTAGLDATGAFYNACGNFKGIGAFFCNFATSSIETVALLNRPILPLSSC
jgi:hypothetical protein